MNSLSHQGACSLSSVNSTVHTGLPLASPITYHNTAHIYRNDAKAALITPNMPIMDGDSVDWIALAVTDEQTLVAMTGVSRQWKQIADKNAHWYRIAILRFPRLANITLRLDVNLDKSGGKAAFMNQYQMEEPEKPHVSSMDEFLVTVEIFFDGVQVHTASGAWPVELFDPKDYDGCKLQWAKSLPQWIQTLTQPCTTVRSTHD